MKETSKKSKALLARAYSLENDAETKALYRDWAKTYDETMLESLAYLTPQKTAERFVSYVKDKACKILDVGSGTGLAGEELAKLGYQNVDALDYSREMLGVAKAREYKGRSVYSSLIVADLNQELQIKDNTYEAIICTGLFTHAHVGAKCLPELFRILKPGSFFATTVHKDIWHSGGFEEQVASLKAEGLIKTHESTMDIYFETDDEPQGFYIIWECLK